MSVADFSSRNTISLEKTTKATGNIIETPPEKINSVYQLEKCIDWITSNNSTNICLQFPDALLKDAPSVALYLEAKTGLHFYILGDTSYGSCCVDEVAAEHVYGDCIIHFGHACLSPVAKLPVLYIFENHDLDLNKLRNNFDNRFTNLDHVIVFYDVTFHHLHNHLCEIFQDENISVSKLQLLSSEKNEGKKLLFGRSFDFNSSQNCSAVFIGPDSVTLGNFILALPEIKWYHYDNDELKEYELNRNRFLMRQLHLIEKVKDAKSIGILIGTLGIKNYLDAVDRIKYLTKSRGKKSYILAVGKPNVAKLANFPEIDIFVSVACTENSLSKDFKEFFKPIVSLFEVEVALGNRPWSSEYITDFRELLKGGSYYKEAEMTSETEVSLVSGKIRNIEGNLGADSTSMELVEKDPGTLVEFTGAEFLANRSWRGLEQNVGQTEVKMAEQGRSGIPLGYENEVSTINEGDKSTT